MTVIIPYEITTQWAPPEGLSVSRWAEKYRVLVSETSSEPGPWRNYRTPYLMAIMDSFSNPYIEKIVFNKGSQIGGTEVLFNMLGYAIHQDPAPALYIMPTLELAKYASRSRIQPMINASSVLSGLKPSNDDDFTTFSMLFPGMVLTLAGANSPASLASRPCRYVFLDEVNKFPRFTGNEADPISLATERQKTFWNKKTVIISTPTEEDGPITRELSMCDVVFDFWVPCPHCGEMQILKFCQFKWPKELDRKDPLYASKVRESAWYECEKCSEIINDLHRPMMIQCGEWRPRQAIKTQPRSVGFTLPSFYSPWLTWGDIAEAFVKSQDYPEKLMNVINSWFAEPWVHRIQVSTESEILKARCDLPPQTVPADAIALTCGIDCQKFGFWFVVRAWARDYTSWLIHYGFIASWDDVEALLDSAYPQQDSGQPMKIWRAAIDSGGGDAEDGLTMTEQCYFWVRANNTGRTYRLWATKGSSYEIPGAVAKYGESRDKTPSGKPLRGGLQLVMIDTIKMKGIVFTRFENAGAGTGFQPAYLNSAVGQDYANQITAEEKRRDRRGRIEWIRIRKDNHLLDAECLCQALVDPTWPGGGISLFRPEMGRGKEHRWQENQEQSLNQLLANQKLQGRRINPAFMG